MQIRFSFILFICMPLVSLTQPVVDSGSYTNANTVLNVETPNPLWVAEQSLTAQTGPDQEWDATDWEPLQETVQSFYPTDEVPAAYQLFFNNEFLYPEYISTHGLLANFDAEQNPLPIQVDDPFTFFRTDATGYYSTGTAFSIEGIPIVTQNDSIERILKFPLTFGDTDTSSIAYLTTVPLFGSFGQSGTRTSEVDGWGVLETPYGIYDVLRIRSEVLLTDTVYIEQTETGQVIERPLQVEYRWISPDIPGPLLTISVVENVTVSASLIREDGVLTTIQASKSGEPLFYPNPAAEVLSFNPDINLRSISIYDSTGKKVLGRSNIPANIDVGHLPRGLYIVLAKSENGYAHREKLIIE